MMPPVKIRLIPCRSSTLAGRNRPCSKKFSHFFLKLPIGSGFSKRNLSGVAKVREAKFQILQCCPVRKSKLRKISRECVVLMWDIRTRWTLNHLEMILYLLMLGNIILWQFYGRLVIYVIKTFVGWSTRHKEQDHIYKYIGSTDG